MKETSAVYRELVELRYSIPLLHQPTGKEIFSRINFLNTGAGQKMDLIVMAIDDGTNVGQDTAPNVSGILVRVNASHKSKSLRKRLFKEQVISPVHHEQAIVSGVKKEGNKITLTPWSSIVLIKPQQNKQGKGIPRQTLIKGSI